MVTKTKIETGTGKVLEENIQFESRTEAIKDQFETQARQTKVVLDTEFQDPKELDVQNTLLWTSYED